MSRHRLLCAYAASGFTLIEILVALFVFTIVSLLMTTALHNLLQSQSGMEKNTERFTALQTTLLFLSRDIEQAVDRLSTVPPDSTNAFQGEPEGMTLTHAGLINPDAVLQRPTLQRIRYVLNHGQLIRLVWPLPDSPPNTVPAKRILLNHLVQLNFSYMNKNRQFHNRWPVRGEENSPLPHAIRVRLTIEHMGAIEQLYPVAGQSFNA